ncbi:MAG TPA: Mur ligase family protein [Blastocatellia bacterium]|nr:Mur ligase family protein [Blastocatellia bacterium]
MDYSESISYLYGLGHEVLAAKYGLESTRLLLEKLDRPDLAFQSVIVAGTNGKGSVAAMIESIARTSGIRTALYTSPHLVKVEERARVNGVDISADEFARHATEVRRAAQSLVLDGRLAALPTFFEHMTAIAISHFRESGAQLAVLEVGLGGRLDATNAVEPLCSVVTQIDFDHQSILGNTIAEIAAEKAAIIKPGARAVIGRQRHQLAAEVLMRRCLETNVLPVFANEPAAVSISDYGRTTFDYESARSNYSRIMVGLRGRHQAENAAAAIEAAELLGDLGFPIKRGAIIKGLRNVQWPGRLELVDDRPAILLDGAHNPGGARALRAYLEEVWRGPVTLIFGAMSDKDITGMAAELFPAAKTIVLTRVKDRRAANNTRLGSPALGGTRNVIFTESVSQAISWARSVTPPEGLICVAGSLHLVGEVKRLLDEEDGRQPA